MDLPPYHLPFRSASNGPATPGSRQHSFDEDSYYSTTPQEILNFPVTSIAESSLDPWLLDMPGTMSPVSSRLSMSPSQGIATPPSDGFYSPPYPEQLSLPAYHPLEQPQPVRLCSTSHPNWVNSGENWDRTYAESELWGTQPFVAQPWASNSYDGYASPNMPISHTHASNNSLPLYTFAMQSQFPVPEVIQSTAVIDSPAGEDDDDDEDLSSEDSNWDEENSDYSKCQSSSPGSRPKTKTTGVREGRWMIPTCSIQQSETRGYLCNSSGCSSAFVRPEHLRRHIKSKHSGEKEYLCVIPGCSTSAFSRGDNLRDHYWTHLQRGGRSGKNRKYTLQELRAILGPKEKPLIRRLREKLRQHHEKERLKKEQRPARAAFAARPTS